MTGVLKTFPQLLYFKVMGWYRGPIFSIFSIFSIFINIFNILLPGDGLVQRTKPSSVDKQSRDVEGDRKRNFQYFELLFSETPGFVESEIFLQLLHLRRSS